MFLKIEGIKKSFSSGENRVKVLKGLNLEIERGEFCVLLGPSGSGKSTLLNIIGGIDGADDGSITIEGERLEDMSEKRLSLYRRKLPNQLSGGQQQRTAIGRAIVKNPDILLCDEPTGALDYHTSKEILKLIEKVNMKYGNTIIMVTHNDAIKDMADRVVKLKDGGIRSNTLNKNKISAAELEW